MDMDSISALLEALKRGDAGKGLDLPDDDSGAKPIAAKISILKAMPLGKADDDEHSLDLHGMDDSGMDDVMPSHDEMGGIPDHGDEASDEAQDNAQIVGALQSMYPEVYDKICKMVLGDDGSDDMGSLR